MFPFVKADYTVVLIFSIALGAAIGVGLKRLRANKQSRTE
jgi:hypothetical protein